MDLNFKGRKWIGSIYHKFEAMCHEVDEFVTKDASKYIENQVQKVNESVKKICSDVLHDFHPPDSEQPKALAATEKQDDATGTANWSTVDVNGVPSHSNEIQSPEELGTDDCRNFDSSEVDSVRQPSVSCCADFPEDEESGSYWKKDTDTLFPKTTVIAEKDIRVENYWEAHHLSYTKDVSTDLPKKGLKQHQLAMNVESSNNGNISLLSKMSTSQDKLSLILDYSSKNTMEEPRISEEEAKCNGSDLSEKTETWFSSDEIDDTVVWNDLDWAAEENVMVEHPDFENVSCSEDKNFYQFFWVKETTPVVGDQFSPEDKTMSSSSLAEEDHSATLVKQFPETVVPDERISCASMVETVMDGYANLCEELKTNLPSGQGGTGLEISLTKEHQLVNSKMVPKCTRSSELPVYLREQHRSNAELSSQNDESLPKIVLTFTDKNFVDKLIAESSVRGECLKILEDKEGGDCQRCFSEEAETDLSLNNDHPRMLSELSLQDNGLLQKHAVMKYSGSLEDLGDLSVHSKDRNLGIERLDSPKYDSSSKSSLRSGAEEHITSIAPNSVLMAADQNMGLRPLHKDVATQTKSCNVLSSYCALPANFSPKVSSAHHVVEAEESSSYSSAEFSCTNNDDRTEKTYCNYTTSSYSTSDFSSMSHLSFSELVSNDKIGNKIPASSMAASSADIEDDLSGDTEDTNLVTIDLSDEGNLEESNLAVDDELFSTPSFRPRKYRSYKERIKEAFGSRKRLVKEYKQLPIWYGDLGNDITRLQEKHILPSPASPSASESTLVSLHACNIGESDWELL